MALKVGKGGADQTDSGPIVGLRKRYEINSQLPLPDFDSAPATAFSAEHVSDKNRNVFAYVCDSATPPRLETIGTLHRIDHRCFMRVIDWDVVFWPPAGKRLPVMICEKPHGLKLLKSPQDTRPPMKEDEIIASFLLPIAQVLRDMHEVGICHGNIRPDNIYMGAEEGGEMMLGECYVAPPLMRLPMAYNTFTNGLCHPLGRGVGISSDDMYAVGVCILALATGEDPTSKYVSEEELQKTKLTYGSYGALAQRYRISSSLMEPLRGLLNDDPKERWGVEELYLWIDGRRLSPKQQTMPPKASRSFQFVSKNFGTARELAFGLAENWDEALLIIEDGTVDNWLRRSLQDDQRVEAVNSARNIAPPTNAEEKDRLLARILMALSLDRPIQLREFSARIEGVPQLMGYLHKNLETRLLFLQLLSAGLIAFYLELRTHADMDDLNVLNKLDKAKGFLTQKGYGNGIERLAYHMNPGLPCMSPMFEHDYVPNIDYLLPALNRYARQKGDDLVSLVDQDVSAYVVVHFNRQITEELRDMNLSDFDYVKVLAELKILAKLQEGSPLKRGMHDLCAGAIIILKPAIERFHSAQIREQVTAKVKKAAATGKLAEILRAVDDQEDNQKDKHGFELASIEYADAIHGQIDLHNDVQKKGSLATELAGQISSALSGLVAIFVAFGYAIYSVF